MQNRDVESVLRGIRESNAGLRGESEVGQEVNPLVSSM